MSHDIIFFDTETTGLLKPDEAELQYQPHMTEYCGIKVDSETLEEIAVLKFMCKVPIPLEDHIVRITGITDEMLALEESFIFHYDELCEFNLGVREAVAHNLLFDQRIIWTELERVGKGLMFPWAIKWTCTVEKSMSIWHKRMRLGQLYEHYTGHPPAKAHRAEDDVRTMIECYRGLRRDGLLD